jgi:glycosyltransferase involved in cell wall biosynthesis
MATPALEIRHQWPPDLTPCDGALVLIQPWEFGGLPAEWIGPIRDVVDELWVPSRFVRDAAISSGVDPARVVVVPNGVDSARFTPSGPRYPFEREAATRFLFVGGCIDRKGVDILLETYLSTFTVSDDVCLVVKPYGTNGVYRESSLEPEIRRAATGNGPKIEVLGDTLDPDAMAALYRSCDVLVHPYRGEGFGLPVAESLASGTPVIVTAGGACDDFCDETDAWMIPASKVPLSPSSWTPSIGGAWWLEPDRAALATAMRHAATDRAARQTKGAAGRARICSEFTWERAAATAHARIATILDRAADRDALALEMSR